MMYSIENFIMSYESIRHVWLIPVDSYFVERRRCCDDNCTRHWREFYQTSFEFCHQVMHLLASAVFSTTGAL